MYNDGERRTDSVKANRYQNTTDSSRSVKVYLFIELKFRLYYKLSKPAISEKRLLKDSTFTFYYRAVFSCINTHISIAHQTLITSRLKLFIFLNFTFRSHLIKPPFPISSVASFKLVIIHDTIASL